MKVVRIFAFPKQTEQGLYQKSAKQILRKQTHWGDKP